MQEILESINRTMENLNVMDSAIREMRSITEDLKTMNVETEKYIRESKMKLKKYQEYKECPKKNMIVFVEKNIKKLAKMNA